MAIGNGFDRRAWETVENWFDPIVLSYEAKLMKPDPAIYRYCEQQCQRSPNEIFSPMIAMKNIRSAAACGWAPTSSAHLLD